MDIQEDQTYFPDVGNFLRETQTRGSETCSFPTFQQLRYEFGPLPSPPDSEEESFEDDISLWSKEKVAKWIESILQEVALSRHPSQQTINLFVMDGKSLLYLSAEDLCQRDPELGPIISDKLMELQKRVESYLDYNSLLKQDKIMWSTTSLTPSSSPCDSSDSEVEFPSTTYRDQPPYVPVAQTTFPHIFTETPPWFPYVSLPPPYSGIPDSRSGGFSLGSFNPEDVQIAIKKEPNLPPSPTFYDGTYCDPFPCATYSPVYKLPRSSLPPPSHVSPVQSNSCKRNCVNVDPKGIEGIPKTAQLYEFILKVLNNPINQHILSWKDKSKGIFYINDTKAFARLWGLHRNSESMSYEKLSRAMRYYYRRNILEQIKGRRLYKFTAKMNKQIMDE